MRQPPVVWRWPWTGRQLSSCRREGRGSRHGVDGRGFLDRRGFLSFVSLLLCACGQDAAREFPLLERTLLLFPGAVSGPSPVGRDRMEESTCGSMTARGVAYFSCSRT